MTTYRPVNIEYRELLKTILLEGNDRGDRTGTGTRSIFGHQIKMDLTKGFPILTTKKIHFKSIVHELLWMISGSTNVKYLQDNGVRIWNEWADAKSGELGPVYGSQWRKWGNMVGVRGEFATDDRWYNEPVDQIKMVIERIKEKPEDRRLLVSAWNPIEVPRMALPPCHVLFQFYTRESDLGGRYLDCHMYQRSADVFLGVPFNISQYALLTSMVAQVVGMYPGKLTISFGDVHIYNNHIDQVNEIISRDPFKHPIPKLVLNPAIKDIDHFKYEDIALDGYKSDDAIKAPVAV